MRLMSHLPLLGGDKTPRTYLSLCEVRSGLLGRSGRHLGLDETRFAPRATPWPRKHPSQGIFIHAGMNKKKKKKLRSRRTPAFFIFLFLPSSMWGAAEGWLLGLPGTTRLAPCLVFRLQNKEYFFIERNFIFKKIFKIGHDQ